MICKARAGWRRRRRWEDGSRPPIWRKPSRRTPRHRHKPERTKQRSQGSACGTNRMHRQLTHPQEFARQPGPGCRVEPDTSVAISTPIEGRLPGGAAIAETVGRGTGGGRGGRGGTGGRGSRDRDKR
jgi:hypothetical protein